MSKHLRRKPVSRVKDPVTQSEAGRIIGVSRQSIPGMIARGELDAESVGGLLFVSRKSAQRVAVLRGGKADKAA